MIHGTLICDICKCQFKEPPQREIWESLRDVARDAGWKYRSTVTGQWVSVDKKDVCPECQD